MMLGGAIVNALSFTGASYEFSQINKIKALKESESHDAAMGQLQLVRDLWNKKWITKIDHINGTLKTEQHAVATFKNVNQAVRKYFIVTGQ